MNNFAASFFQYAIMGMENSVILIVGRLMDNTRGTLSLQKLKDEIQNDLRTKSDNDNFSKIEKSWAELE